jgi:topoisomerase-4 subunit A
LKRLLIKEIEADAKQYGDARRTLIQQEKRATFEVRVVDEPVTVIVSQRGWVRTQKGHGLDLASFAFKSGDALYGAFQCRTPDILVAWGSNGRVYSVAVAQLPGGRGDGVPVTSLIELESGSSLLHFYAAPAEQQLLLTTDAGFGFTARMSDLVSRVKAGKAFMTVDAGARPLTPMPLWDAARQVACLADDGRLLIFGLDELKALSGGGRGVTLIALDDAQKLLQAVPIAAAGVVLSGTGRGGKAQEAVLSGEALQAHVGKRARRGRVSAVKFVVQALRPVLPAN